MKVFCILNLFILTFFNFLFALILKSINKNMRKNYFKISIYCSLIPAILFNASIITYAQNVHSLDEIVVTASRSLKKQGDVGKIVEVITREELDAAQGRSLAELLNTTVGINIGGSGNNLADSRSVYLRGATAANTLILINGIAVNDASGITGEFNISNIAIDQIERIEVLKGASSTLYGSDAVAGVINIITKKGEGALKANALLSGGSYKTFKQAVGLNGQLDKTSIAFNFSNLDAKGFSIAEPPVNQTGFDRDGFSQQALQFNIGQYITNNLKIDGGLQLSNQNGDLDMGGFSDAKNSTYKKTALLANLGTQINLKNGDLKFIFSQNNVSNKFSEQGILTDNIGKITNAEGVLSYRISSFLDFTSGINYKYSETEQINIYNSLLAKDANSHLSSIYTSFFLKGGDFFRMELGGRYNKHNIFGENFTYTINPSILINNSIKVYVNVSSAFRAPSLYQLTSIYRNPDGLDPETSYTYETGFSADILKNKLSVTTSFYKRKIEDLIDFGVTSNGNYVYLNKNEQNDNGVEVKLTYKPTSAFNLHTFYTYSDGKLKTDANLPAVDNLLRRPKNTVGAQMSYNFNQKFNASLIYKWVDQKQDVYWDDNTYSSVNSTLHSYHKFDAYAQYKIQKNISLFADVKNIFNVSYHEFAGYQTMGTNFNAGLSFNFQ